MTLTHDLSLCNKFISLLIIILLLLFTPVGGFHRASSLGSRHQMPASYEAAWSLPRLDFHQLVVPSFARRTIILSCPLPHKEIGAAAKHAPPLSFPLIESAQVKCGPTNSIRLGCMHPITNFKFSRLPIYSM